ncbi:MAG: DNA replication/repair protein RecF [Clostridia bacterium]|nr:DNA replication/repair protein RecF [Clostridia bacterium]
MRIDRLALFDFRNYAEFNAEFVPGVNLIVGDNAQGKTNLLEAISYLGAGKSFRTRKEAEMIRFGAEFCEMNCDVFSFERTRTIKTILFSGRRPRQLYLSDVKKKSFAEISGMLSTVLFCPEDLLILKTGASSRRKLIDTALCQLRPNYDKALTEYGKLYDGKSRILKDRFENPSLENVLPEYNERMAQVGAILIHYRAKYLKKLSEYASRFHSEFSGGRESLLLTYQTVSTIDDPFAPVEEVCEELREHQKSHYRAELESQQCLSGPHKDDFDVTLGGLSVKAFGSQGQTRTAAISLKLAEREIFRIDTGEEPVLLLDDVLSELDPGRQDFVLNQIKSGQVFITCCEKDRLTDLGKVITIENGHLR